MYQKLIAMQTVIGWCLDAPVCRPMPKYSVSKCSTTGTTTLHTRTNKILEPEWYIVQVTERKQGTRIYGY